MNTESNHAGSPWVVEATAESFEHDVFERSRERPVVIDFWAPWCAPCRVLGPVLENLAAESDGQFVLVKANTELVPQQAAEFNVQSIPAVFGVRDGEVVDFFVGVLPEPQLRQWLARLQPSPAEQLHHAAERLKDDDPVAAEAKWREAIQLSPNLATPQIALASLLFEQQRWDEAESVLSALQDRGLMNAQAERIRAELARQQQAAAIGDVDSCRRALQHAPDNAALKLQLAVALSADEAYEEALQLALQAVQQDSTELREQARQLMVDVFHLLPDESALTSEYRRKLATALF